MSYASSVSNRLVDPREYCVKPAQIRPGADRHPNTGRPWMVYSLEVRNALREVTSSSPQRRLVPTDDLQTMDAVHIDAAGLLATGRRMAEQVVSLGL